MNLAPKEVERFFRVWFPLLRHVNDERHVIPDSAWPQGGPLNVQDAAKLRDALWADDSLLQAFLSRNPAGLSAADLALAESWQNRRFGNLWVVRYLKWHTVFLDDTGPGHLYGVLGLNDPLEKLLGPSLPRMIRTALLPFEDRITYDGLLSGTNLFFGSGIRGDLNTKYRNLKEREGIITSLLPQPAASPEQARKAVHSRNEKLLSDFRKELYASRLSTPTVERHMGALSAFAEVLQEQQPPCPLIDLDGDDVAAYLQQIGAGTKAAKDVLTSFRRFARFLDDTQRLEPDEAWALIEFLRAYQ